MAYEFATYRTSTGQQVHVSTAWGKSDWKRLSDIDPLDANGDPKPPKPLIKLDTVTKPNTGKKSEEKHA